MWRRMLRSLKLPGPVYMSIKVKSKLIQVKGVFGSGAWVGRRLWLLCLVG